MIGVAKELIQWLLNQEPEKQFEIKEYKKKRSLNANAYAWALITKIANVIRISKEECYFNMLKHYGQSEIISVLSEIDISGYVKYYEPIGHAFLQGKNFTHYKIYKGSSEYDTKEMSILIDGIVQECRNLNIETMPEQEIARLIEIWKEGFGG